MLNIAEYRSRADRLADHLPWVALVAPGVVLNKDGSFQRTFRFRGPDLESATEAELVSTCARANNVLKRLGSGWALFFAAERREALGYPDGAFGDAASVASADEVGGRYCEDCHVSSVVTGDTVQQISTGVRDYAVDPERAAALWRISEKLVGENF